MGSKLVTLGAEPRIMVPTVWFKNKIQRWIIDEHSRYWNTLPGLRHSKLFINKVDNQLARKLRKSNKSNLRSVIQIVTGHNSLNYFQHKLGNVLSPNCTQCEESEETGYHFLCECPKYAFIRLIAFGCPLITKNIELHKISKFVRLTNRFL